MCKLRYMDYTKNEGENESESDLKICEADASAGKPRRRGFVEGVSSQTSEKRRRTIYKRENVRRAIHGRVWWKNSEELAK